MPLGTSRAAVIQIISRLVARRISIRARSKSAKSVDVSVQLSVGPRSSAVAVSAPDSLDRVRRNLTNIAPRLSSPGRIAARPLLVRTRQEEAT